MLQVSKYAWDHYEQELRNGGNLLYKWQYDIRWAATALRHEGKLLPVDKGRKQSWRVSPQAQSVESR